MCNRSGQLGLLADGFQVDVADNYINRSTLNNPCIIYFLKLELCWLVIQDTAAARDTLNELPCLS